MEKGLVLCICTTQGVQCRKVLVVNLFRNFEIILFCFVVVMSDLVRDVEAK